MEEVMSDSVEIAQLPEGKSVPEGVLMSPVDITLPIEDAPLTCHEELHLFSMGFLIKGLELAGTGSYIEALNFVKISYEIMNSYQIDPQDMNIYKDRCNGFTLRDKPPVFACVSTERSLGSYEEFNLLKFESSFQVVRIALVIGRYLDAENGILNCDSACGEAAMNMSIPDSIKKANKTRFTIVKADLLLSMAKYEEASISLLECSSMRNDSLGDELGVAIQSRLGKCAVHQGLYQKAISIYQSCLEQQNLLFQKEKGRSIDVSQDYDDATQQYMFYLVEAYCHAYKFQLALPLMRQVSTMRKTQKGHQHILTLEASYMIGYIFYRNYQFGQAVALWDDLANTLASKEVESCIGKDTLLLAAIFIAKGDIFRILGKADDAKTAVGTALRLRKFFYSALNHPDLVDCVEANAYNMLTRARTYGSCEPLLQQVLEHRRAVHGESHPAYARALYRQGIFLKETGNVSDSVECLNKALTISSEALGDAALPVLDIRELLAQIRVERGDLDGAADEVNSLVILKRGIFEKVPEYVQDPESHPDVASLFLIMSEIELKRGKSMELAFGYALRVFKAYESSSMLKKTHPRTIAARGQAYYVKYQLNNTVTRRNMAYNKMRECGDQLIECGYTEDHPWLKRFHAPENEYPADLEKGTILNATDELDELESSADQDAAAGDDESIALSENLDGSVLGPKGTGSGETDGVDDGGAAPVEGDSPDQSISKYLYIQAKQLMFEGHLMQAKTLFEQCHILRVRIFGLCEVSIFAQLFVGEVVFRMGNYTEAENIFQLCIAEFSTTCGARSLPIAETMYRLGLNYHVLGDFKAAHGKLDETLLIRQEILKDSSRDTANSYYAIAMLKLDLYQIEDAELFFNKSFSIRKNLFSLGHLDVAESFIAKALVAESRGKWVDVYQNLIQALVVRENVLGSEVGSNSLMNADISFIRARVKFQEAAYEAATTFFNTSLEIYTKVLGAEHPKVWSVLYNKAELNRILCNYVEARSIHETVMSKRVAFFGESHISVADSLYGLGMVLLDLSHYNRAEDYFKRSIQIYKKEFFDRHPKISNCEFGIGECYRCKGDLDSAQQFHEKVKRNRQDNPGKIHPDYFASQQVSIDMKIRSEDPKERADTENAIKILLLAKKKYFGDDHPEVAELLNSYGELLRMQARFAESNAILDEALYIRKKCFGEKHPKTVESINNRALRNAWFRVKNLALEKAQTLLMESQTFLTRENSVLESVGQGSQSQAEQSSDNKSIQSGSNFDVGNNSNDFIDPEDSIDGGGFAESRIPVFDNSDFKKSNDELVSCIKALEKFYPPNEKYGNDDSPVHPLVANIRGNIGIVEKLEAQSKDQFAKRLSPDERRLFLAAEQAAKVRELEDNDDEIVFEPGQKIIHEAIVYLEQFGINREHYWQSKFRGLCEGTPDVIDDSVKQAQETLEKALKNMTRNLIQNAYQDYEETNKNLSSEPKRAAHGHILVATAQYGMAKCLSWMCKYEDARFLFDSSIQMQRKYITEDNFLLSDTLFEKAELLRALGLFSDAINTFEESRVIRKKLRKKTKNDPDKFSLPELQAMLGIAYSNVGAGKFEVALKQVNEIIEFEKVFSTPIPLELANAYVVQCRALIQLHRYNLAYLAAEKAQGIRKEQLGKYDHLDLAECLHLKAELLLYQKGDSMNALRLVSLALSMRKRCILSSQALLDDYEIAARQAEILFANQQEDDDDEDAIIPKELAQKTALKAPNPLDDPSVAYPNHGAIIESLRWKGKALHELGKYDLAIESYWTCTDMVNTVFGAEHYYTSIVQHLIGNSAQSSYQFNLAHDCYLTAKTSSIRYFGLESSPSLEILVSVAINYRGVCKYEEAQSMLAEYLEIASKYLEKTHPVISMIHWGLGQVYLDLGIFNTSIEHFQMCLKLRKSLYGNEAAMHPMVALSHYSCGEVLRISGHYSMATTHYDKALYIAIQKCGDNHPITAMIYHGLSHNNRVQGKFIESKVTYEQGMVIRRDVFGRNHPETADSLLGIAFNSFDQGLYEGGKPYFLKALQIFENLLLPELPDGSTNHSLIADALYGCAENARALADYAVAEDYYQRVIEMRMNIFGFDHYSTQMAYCGLSEIYRLTENFEDAKKWNTSVIDTLKRLLPDNDKRVAKILLYAGYTQQDLAQYVPAKGLFERSYAMLCQVFRINHGETARPMYAMAELSRITGKYDVAKAQHDAAMAARKFSYVGQQGEIALSYYGMAKTYNCMGIFDKAYILFMKAIQIQKPQLGEKHPELLASLMGLAECLACMGRVSSIKTVFVEHEELYGGEFVGTDGSVTSENKLEPKLDNDSQDEVKQLEQAIGYELYAYPLYICALQGVSKCFGPSNMSVASASLGIVRCLHDMGRFREAALLCRDVLKLQRQIVGDVHPVLSATMGLQAQILISWGRLYPVEETPIFNPEIAAQSVKSLKTSSIADLSIGWGVESSKMLAKAGFSWKHGNCDAEEKQAVSGGYMGYQYPNRPVLKRESVFDDNLTKPINTIPVFQSEKNSVSSFNIDHNQYIESSTTLPLTGNAQKLIEVALEYQYKCYHPTGEHPLTAELQYQKGVLLFLRGMHGPSKKALLHSLSMRQRFLAPEHPDIAKVLYYLAENMRSLGDIDGARSYYEKSLLIRENCFGRTHVAVAESLLGLAKVYVADELVQRAKDFIKEALTIRLKWMDKAHPLVASASQSLASMLLTTNDSIEEARIMLKHAIESKIKAYGQYHYEVCSCCNDYALVLKKLGRYQDAIKIFQDSFTVQRRLFGEEHADMATTLHNHAATLVDMGELEKAEKLYKESIAMKRLLYGYDHPIIGTALHNLAGLYQMLDKLDSADKLYMEALEIKIKAHGELHTSVAETYNNLGLLVFLQSKYSEAQRYLGKALAIKRKVYEDIHPSTASTLHNLAAVFHSIEGYDEAERYYAECVHIRAAVYGGQHPDTIAAFNNLQLVRNKVPRTPSRQARQRIPALKELFYDNSAPVADNSSIKAEDSSSIFPN